MRAPDGQPVMVEVHIAGGPVFAQVWRAQVGRVPLYLLDTNFDAQRRPEDREITDQLYGGDREMRIRQEILLGIGGYRALAAVGLAPAVYHMNEGHSAFLALEHVRRADGDPPALVRGGARTGLGRHGVHDPHTGRSRPRYFPAELMDRYFGDYARRLGISRDEFLALRPPRPGDRASSA